MTEVARLAAFAHQLLPSDVPPRVLSKMRTHLIDTLAAGFAGSSTPLAARLRSLYVSPAGVSSVWGGGTAESRSAALINGVSAHVLEVDDTGGCDHSGAVVAPAALAVLESSGHETSVDELLTAITLGYEVARRVQFFLGGYSPLNAKGWHSTSVCGPIGAAAAAAKLWRLDEGQTADAIGIATSMMSGGWSFKAGGGENKTLHAGLAAAHGVESASLARAGVSGSRAAFSNTWGGLGNLFADGAGDATALVDELGQRWVAEEASIKPFPSCASSHRMIQLAESRIVPERLPLAAVDEIVVRVGPLVADMCGESRVERLDSLKERQLSIPYGVALTMLRGSLGFGSLTTRPKDVPGLTELLRKVRIEVDESISGAFGEGSIVVRSGQDRHEFLTDDITDPRQKISTTESVLRKAHEVLQSAGFMQTVPVLTRLSSAAGASSASEVLAGLADDLS